MVDADIKNQTEKPYRSIGTSITEESNEGTANQHHEASTVEKKVPGTTGITLKTELVDSSIIESSDSIKNKKPSNKHIDESLNDILNVDDAHTSKSVPTGETKLEIGSGKGSNKTSVVDMSTMVPGAELAMTNPKLSKSFEKPNTATSTRLDANGFANSGISSDFTARDTHKAGDNKSFDHENSNPVEKNNFDDESHNYTSSHMSIMNSNNSVTNSKIHSDSNTGNDDRTVSSIVNSFQGHEKSSLPVVTSAYDEEDDDGNKTIDLEAVHEEERSAKQSHSMIETLDPGAYSKSLRNKKSILIEDNDTDTNKSVIESTVVNSNVATSGSLANVASSSGNNLQGSSALLGGNVVPNTDHQSTSNTVILLGNGVPANNILNSQNKNAVNSTILSGNNTVNGIIPENKSSINAVLGSSPLIHSTNGVVNTAFSDVNSAMTSLTSKDLPNASLKVKNKQKNKKPASSRAEIFEAQVEGVVDDNNVTSDILTHEETNNDIESLHHVAAVASNTPHSSFSAQALADSEVAHEINATSNNSLYNSNSITDLNHKVASKNNNNEITKNELLNSEPVIAGKTPSILDESSTSCSPNNKRQNSDFIKNLSSNTNSMTTATPAAIPSPAKHAPPPPPTSNYNFINFSAGMNDLIEDNHNFYDELNDFDRRTYQNNEENSSVNSNINSNTDMGYSHVNHNKIGSYRGLNHNTGSYKNSPKVSSSKKKKKGRSHSYYEDSRFIKDPRYLDLYRQQQLPASYLNGGEKTTNILANNKNSLGDVHSNSSDSESDYNTDDFKYQNFTKYKQQQLPNRRSVSHYTNNGKRKNSSSKFNVLENDAFYKRRGHNLGNKDKMATSTVPDKIVKNAVLLNMDSSNINKKISNLKKNSAQFVDEKNNENKNGDNGQLRTTISKLFDSHGKNLKRYDENDYYDDDIDIDDDDDDSYMGEELDDEASLLNYDYYSNYNGIAKNPKRNDSNIPGIGSNLGNNKRNSRIIKNRIIYKRPRSNFQTMKNVCWTFISILVLLSFGFLWGFILASTKNLEDVAIKNINHIVVSNDELIFDIKCEGVNPGFGLVSIENVDLDLFVKTSYLSFMDFETFFIGTVETLEYPLLFPGNLFKTIKKSESESTIKLIDPGKNSTKPAYDGGDDESHIDGAYMIDRFENDDDSNLEKWKKSIKHPFELIVRGKFSYILPFTSSARAISVYKSVSIDPSATY